MECKKCKEIMSMTDTEYQVDVDTFKREWECEECGLTCQENFTLEHYEADPIFWSDEM